MRTARVTDVAMSVIASADFASSQPATADGKVLLTWDGRLDNRSSVAAACNLEDDGLDDATLVAKAYSILGPALWPTLVGDYAVACFDLEANQLCLARDPFGTRPLYYYIDDLKVIWCSELNYFVEFLGSRLELDDEFIASYLLLTEAHLRTPYRDVSPIRPGYATVIDKGHVRDRGLWDPASCVDVRLESDADYEARFRELFAQSVRRRLRTPGALMAELSGGLDSSSIVSVAHHLLCAAKREPANLATVSYVYDGSRTSDERHYIAKVEELRGIDTNVIQHRNAVRLSHAPRAARPSVLHIFHETYEAVQEIVESLDASIMLSGFGGDQVTLNETTLCPNLIPLVKRGRVLTAFRNARKWAHAHKTTTMEFLWTSLIWPILPLRVQALFTPGILFPKSWMGPILVEHVKARKHELIRPNSRRSWDPVLQQQFEALDRAASFTSQCYLREQGCCDATYPFLDRSLIEFMIGIPGDQKLRSAESRSIHRRAMKGVLPEEIRQRKTKSGPDEPLLRAVSHNWTDLAEIFRDAEVSRRGYIDGQSFLADLVRARHGNCRFTAYLARVLSLELWLRTHSGTHPHAFTTDSSSVVSAGSGKRHRTQPPMLISS